MNLDLLRSNSTLKCSWISYIITFFIDKVSYNILAKTARRIDLHNVNKELSSVVITDMYSIKGCYQFFN